MHIATSVATPQSEFWIHDHKFFLMRLSLGLVQIVNVLLPSLLFFVFCIYPADLVAPCSHLFSLLQPCAFHIFISCW